MGKKRAGTGRHPPARRLSGISFGRTLSGVARIGTAILFGVEGILHLGQAERGVVRIDGGKERVELTDLGREDGVVGRKRFNQPIEAVGGRRFDGGGDVHGKGEKWADKRR